MPSSPQAAAALSPIAREVQRVDPDRFLTALFAPAEFREDVLAVYAFNSEIARIRETVNEPVLGVMRVQWWRDTLEAIYRDPQAVPAHPVAQALAAAIHRHTLPQELFDELLEARERDMDERPIPDQESLALYVRCTGGHLARLVAMVLCGHDASVGEVAGKVGAAYALGGLLRAVPFHARHDRLYVPTEILNDHQADVTGLLAGKIDAGGRSAVAELRAAATTALREARHVWKGSVAADHRKAAVAAVLPGTMAEGYLKRLERAGDDPFESRLAVPTRRPVTLAWRAWRSTF
ncbi:phytoene/squalene synthase family protein [Insolitispirillum peregrinum]|uniref:Phytoene synthase n=1 Tax=Insolitispirillum peregrinum TaxID=80876 RepID=A0A1N7IVY8_9PROT|nr:phytoene/squalene synthase family protein [Insolitispirillum peregrinum]SIS41197.1 phytoene synthase [Insolitispirillum peregrinum]